MLEEGGRRAFQTEQPMESSRLGTSWSVWRNGKRLAWPGDRNSEWGDILKAYPSAWKSLKGLSKKW